jgi:hypothetical protein
MRFLRIFPNPDVFLIQRAATSGQIHSPCSSQLQSPVRSSHVRIHNHPRTPLRPQLKCHITSIAISKRIASERLSDGLSSQGARDSGRKIWYIRKNKGKIGQSVVFRQSASVERQTWGLSVELCVLPEQFDRPCSRLSINQYFIRYAISIRECTAHHISCLRISTYEIDQPRLLMPFNRR